MTRYLALLFVLLAVTAEAQVSYWFQNWQKQGNAQLAQQYFMLAGTGITFTYTPDLQHVTINAIGGGGGLITLLGDVTGSSVSPVTTTLKNTGTPGTYVKTTFDAQGRETSGSTTIGNADLFNSSLTYNGKTVSLGGSATLSLASADFAGQGGSAFWTLHGSGGGNPSWGLVNLATDVTGSLPNGSLANSSVTFNGETASLGGSATLTLASSDFANQGTTTTVLHGNASGNPSFAAVDLVSDITGNLGVAHLNSGSGAGATTFWRGDATWAVPPGLGGSGSNFINIVVTNNAYVSNGLYAASISLGTNAPITNWPGATGGITTSNFENIVVTNIAYVSNTIYAPNILSLQTGPNPPYFTIKGFDNGDSRESGEIVLQNSSQATLQNLYLTAHLAAFEVSPTLDFSYQGGANDSWLSYDPTIPMLAMEMNGGTVQANYAGVYIFTNQLIGIGSATNAPSATPQLKPWALLIDQNHNTVTVGTNTALVVKGPQTNTPLALADGSLVTADANGKFGVTSSSALSNSILSSATNYANTLSQNGTNYSVVVSNGVVAYANQFVFINTNHVYFDATNVNINQFGYPYNLSSYVPVHQLWTYYPTKGIYTNGSTATVTGYYLTNAGPAGWSVKAAKIGGAYNYFTNFNPSSITGLYTNAVDKISSGAGYATIQFMTETNAALSGQALVLGSVGLAQIDPSAFMNMVYSTYYLIQTNPGVIINLQGEVFTAGSPLAMNGPLTNSAFAPGGVLYADGNGSVTTTIVTNAGPVNKLTPAAWSPVTFTGGVSGWIPIYQ